MRRIYGQPHISDTFYFGQKVLFYSPSQRKERKGDRLKSIPVIKNIDFDVNGLHLMTEFWW
jgi:outer membrane protein assembly factor BamE (lipoprotein component of BamABCDE complex)